MNSSVQKPSPFESEHSRLTLEAMDDVDADRVIDHQTVLDWADSLICPEKPLDSPQ